MADATLAGHFDGKRICIDEPYNLKPNTKVMITVLPNTAGNINEPESWYNLSASGLDQAYGEDEPEYSTELIIEKNPFYEGK